MPQLDAAPFLARPGVPGLLRALGAADGQTRLVGGAVRDALLALPFDDIDLATRLSPERVQQQLHEAGLRAIPTGLAHGTITAVAGGARYEITTLRRDVRSFGRHAEIAFTDDWRADAARRDFTLNALYADPLSGALFDYFGGLGDLQARRVRFIGDPLQRIAEDHLRILRFFRFSARFSLGLDPAGLAACAARANDLMALSRERIRDELLKLLALPAAADTLGAMIDHSILAPVLPEIHPAGVQELRLLLAAETGAGVAGDSLRRLSALLGEGADTADAIAARLRLSNAERTRLVAAATRTAVPDDPLALAYRIGGPATLDRLLLTGDRRAAPWAGQLRSYHRPRLPISGKDLIAMGLTPGPAVSRRLREVEERWLAAGFPHEEDRVRAIARDVLGRR